MTHANKILFQSTMSSAERLKNYKEQKLKKRREQRLLSYHANKTPKLKENSSNKDAKGKREYREQKREEKEIERVRKQKYRQALKTRTGNEVREKKCCQNFLKCAFANRTSKHRAIKKLKQALPSTPKRRSATLAAYLKNSNSPTVNKLQQAEVISSPEEQENNRTGNALLLDIKTVLDSCKNKRSKDSLSSRNVIISSISGEHVKKSKCQNKVACKLGLKRSRVRVGHRNRTKNLKSQKSCWNYTKRKTRCDAISEETKRIAYDFWLKPGVSRPTGNKSDVKRERLGPKLYSSHMVHVLEKTQTDVYLDFVKQYPAINISQRSIENCKP